MNDQRCIAPEAADLGDGRHLCGAPATTTRTVAGLVCSLCDLHAREIDRDFAPRPRLMGWDDDGGYEDPNDEES